jgi:hypothetical protein
MKKLLCPFLFLILSLFNIFSDDTLQYSDVKKIIETASDFEIKEYSKKISNEKIKWQGIISNIKENNQDSDLIFVELDKPDRKNQSSISPDLVFVMDKKISSRLSVLQFIVMVAFIDGIVKIDDKFYINIKDVILQGIMK